MEKQTDQSLTNVGNFKINLSPSAFHMSARHYYKCKQDFEVPDKFSPVPYFLLCRSIELSIKARHLKRSTQSNVKNNYGHNLLDAYNALQANEKTLSKQELDILSIADTIYSSKGFEYYVPEHALRAYKDFPSIEILDQIANKLLEDYIQYEW